jgi:hypothetical protein
MKKLLITTLIVFSFFASQVSAVDTVAIRTNLDAIRILIDDTAALLLSAPLPTITTTVPPTVPAPGPISANPYTDTPARTQIIPDAHLAFTGTAPYLQSRFWRSLWNVADKMGIKIAVVNACLLSGVPPENTAHYEDGRTVDIRYPESDSLRIELIRLLIIAGWPDYELPRDYNRRAVNDFEVRVSPEIKTALWPLTAGWAAQMRQLYIDKVQADPAGQHDNHLHLRFAE